MNGPSSDERVSDAARRSRPALRSRGRALRRIADQTRLLRWLAGFLAAATWLALVYGLPLQSLRAARSRARVELADLLQKSKPDPAAVLGAFDQATEEILFAAAGPYLILAASTVFVVAHLVGIKRRLNAAERTIEAMRDVVLGVDRIPLK